MSPPCLHEYVLWTRWIRYVEFWPSKFFQFTLFWTCLLGWGRPPLQCTLFLWDSGRWICHQPSCPVTTWGHHRLSHHLWGILWLLIHICFMIFSDLFISILGFISSVLNLYMLTLINEHLHWTNEEGEEKVMKDNFAGLREWLDIQYEHE